MASMICAGICQVKPGDRGKLFALEVPWMLVV